MLVGFAMWIYTLLLPALTLPAGCPSGSRGPFGIAWLRPQQLFGLIGWDPLTHGTFWSLLVNIGGDDAGVGALASGRRRTAAQRAVPRSLCAAAGLVAGDWHGRVRVGDLLALAERIVGERQARVHSWSRPSRRNRELQPDAAADRAWVQFTERLLAAAIGAASARLVLTSALRGSGMDVAEVVAVLDEAGQEMRFNRGSCRPRWRTSAQGISVVDPDMRLVAWNRRYQQMFGYPRRHALRRPAGRRPDPLQR